MIAIGTGGIKPCVSAFGGDQFGPGSEKQLAWFFSLFYLSINAGSLISTFVTPVFRQEVACSARGDCFPLAFGVPAVLMICALALFWLGRSQYTLIPPAKGNIILETTKCIGVSHFLRVLFTFTNFIFTLYRCKCIFLLLHHLARCFTCKNKLTLEFNFVFTSLCPFPSSSSPSSSSSSPSSS